MNAPKHADIDLERELLASYLDCEADYQRSVANSTERAEPTDMSTLEHQELLEAIYAITARDTEANFVTLIGELESRSARQGVINAYHELMGRGYHSTNTREMMRRVGKLAAARRARAALQLALSRLDSMDFDGMREHALEASGEALASAASASLSAGAIANIAADRIYQAEHASERLNPRCGHGVLDYALGAIPRRSMVMIGGRTGSGKSSLMLSMAIKQATEQGHRPGIVSLEDDEEIYGARVLASLSEVSSENLLNAAHMNPVERGMLAGHASLGIAKAQELGARFAFALNRPVNEVLQAVRSLVTHDKCTVIYVDYIQAIKLGLKHDLKNAISDAAQSIKSECQSLGVPLFLGSQLSRPSKDKAYAEPSMFDLKETGTLENMSEAIAILWKTGDEEGAQVLGKVAKVKWNARRPRFEIRFRWTGAVDSIERWEHPEPEQKPSNNGVRTWRA